MPARRKQGDPWKEQFRKRYCYHQPWKNWKTETLVRKLHEAADGKKLAAFAWEISYRDPALALAEVKKLALGSSPRAKGKDFVLCLHHVADATMARELFEGEGFDPDALHLTPFLALLDDFLEALPSLDSKEAERRLRKLGFLAGPVASPMSDGPDGSAAHASSFSRGERAMARFLVRIFPAPSLAAFRDEIAEHLRRTCQPEAYRFLVDRWAAGEVRAVGAIAAVDRVGYRTLVEELGEARVRELLAAFVRELHEPAGRFEESALDNGLLPGSLKDLPPAAARTVALGYFDAPRFADRRSAAAMALMEADPDGPTIVLERVGHLPGDAVREAAKRMPYEAVRACLERAGFGADHPLLRSHPDAPPDLGLVDRALASLSSDAGGALATLARVAADSRHPHREIAFGHLLSFGGAGGDARVRRHALYQLGEVRDRRAAPVIREAMGDPTLADARLLVQTALTRVLG